jgi:integrase/recombinase XerD
LSESTKQARAAAYISFTGFLSRRTEGMIKKGSPSKEIVSRTFYQIRDKVKSNALNQKQWLSFLHELKKINTRDALIAKMILQGGKRKSEVLQIKVSDINFEKNEISYKQLKTKGMEKIIIITYPQYVMEELFLYLKGRTEGYVFITSTGNRISPSQLNRSFQSVGKKIGVPFRITPHTLRTSTITFLSSQGFSDSDILKVTGHSSAKMIRLYDKSETALNITKQINLI